MWLLVTVFQVQAFLFARKMEAQSNFYKNDLNMSLKIDWTQCVNIVTQLSFLTWKRTFFWIRAVFKNFYSWSIMLLHEDENNVALQKVVIISRPFIVKSKSSVLLNLSHDRTLKYKSEAYWEVYEIRSTNTFETN